LCPCRQLTLINAPRGSGAPGDAYNASSNVVHSERDGIDTRVESVGSLNSRQLLQNLDNFGELWIQIIDLLINLEPRKIFPRLRVPIFIRSIFNHIGDYEIITNGLDVCPLENVGIQAIIVKEIH
jgi:hypothetical protein